MAIAVLIIVVVIMIHSSVRIKKDTDIIEAAKRGEASEHTPDETGGMVALVVVILLVIFSVSMGLGGALWEHRP